MKMKYMAAMSVMSVMLAMCGGQVFAATCEVSVDANDAMKYDKSEIVIDKSCKEFTINLTHSGKLARNVMGHNLVITKVGDAPAVARDGIAAGLDNQYVKSGDERIIVATNIIGGGEKASKKFQVSKLKAGESYQFFCSFPGHIGLMKGNVSLK